MIISNIEHHPEFRLFVMKVGDDFAKIEYTERDNCYYLVHSEVPKHLRGQGIGKILIEKTFEYLHNHKIKGIAVCSYIKAIVDRSEKLKKIS